MDVHKEAVVICDRSITESMDCGRYENWHVVIRPSAKISTGVMNRIKAASLRSRPKVPFLSGTGTSIQDRDRRSPSCY